MLFNDESKSMISPRFADMSITGFSGGFANLASKAQCPHCAACWGVPQGPRVEKSLRIFLPLSRSRCSVYTPRYACGKYKPYAVTEKIPAEFFYLSVFNFVFLLRPPSRSPPIPKKISTFFLADCKSKTDCRIAFLA